ncbi:hypothetical protein N7512_006291 [Penicillium capsulatum]|nr:hypothetical protein N7512_006291 [Penicillium capsulatum]
MSLFSFGDLPTIQTRKALLLLDFQNDFVRPSGALHVPNISDVLEHLPPLVAAFRRRGDVIWVRSQYESAQSLSDWNFGDRIILEKEQPKPKPMPSSDEVIEAASEDDPPEPVDPEAFLSGESATCCAPQSSGFQLPAPVLKALDLDQDTILDKTGYSALESNDLVLSFRTRFVTEIYLCGSLSNVSVYATALDAVRNGFSVTLVEDCLGYRDFDRHREAMRCMADILGATGLEAQELIQELDYEETDDIARSGPSPYRRPTAPVGIESVMGNLEVQAEDPATPEDKPDEDACSLVEMASITRAQRAASAQARAPAEGKKKVRARVRRPKRPDPAPDAKSQTSDGPSKSSPKPSDTPDAPDKIGEGDSRILQNIDLPTDAFERIRNEVCWQKMYHLSGQVPRLVAVQGRAQDDGAVPVYRHPADESPPLNEFSPAVDEVRVAVERVLGHPLNHALIQLYRDGQDSISEHSDKTLDIVRGSSICNVSLGAERVMVLRTKTSAGETKDGEPCRTTQRVPLAHGSLFVLGEETNMRWLHGLWGERISLTFRHIGTYIDPKTNNIWGQGAVGKTAETGETVVHGDDGEIERLIRAFGQENRSTEFNWDEVYGKGFNVVNFVTTAPAQVVFSGDAVADLRVKLGLGENGVRYETVDHSAMEVEGDSASKQPVYVDSRGHSVTGDLAILKHLIQGPGESTRPGVENLKGGHHLPWIEDLRVRWREHCTNSPDIFDADLDHCEHALEGEHYLGGAVFSIDDCSLWPVLREMAQAHGEFDARFKGLNQYYHRVAKRGIVRIILDETR